MAVTIVDIARKLDISHATVSRVLNGRCADFISEKTRERVLIAAGEMGYQPNRLARALATGKSNLIAVSLPNLSGPFYSQIINHVQMCLNRDGFDMIPLRNEGTINVSGWPVDGALRFGAIEGRVTLLTQLAEMKIPLVTISTQQMESGDFVGVDLYPASRHAVEHLVRIGRKRIAFVVLDYRNRDSYSRRDAYVEVMNEAGMKPEIITLPDLSRSTARAMIRDYVAANGHPDGLFCMNDDYAIGACRAFRDCGLRIPDDAGVVGCDGIEDTVYMDPSVSTIVQPVAEMCEVGWKFLRGRMEDPEVPSQQTVLRAKLEVHGSSDISKLKEEGGKR